MLGAVILKHMLKLSDRETIRQIRENRDDEKQRSENELQPSGNTETSLTEKEIELTEITSAGKPEAH
ncbi:MAG: hypothetical protein ACRDE2_15510, partial [Chitinophagaceae bacterium]